MIIKYKVLKIYVECNEACLGYFYMPIATNFLKKTIHLACHTLIMKELM